MFCDQGEQEQGAKASVNCPLNPNTAFFLLIFSKIASKEKKKRPRYPESRNTEGTWLRRTVRACWAQLLAHYKAGAL